MLLAAIEEEVEAYVTCHKSERDEHGHRLVVRNGHHPERSIQTGLGPIAVRRPKVNDKRTDDEGVRFQFQSSILPPYLKRTKSLEELVPWLYLRGISSGDFPQALQATDKVSFTSSGVFRFNAILYRTFESGSDDSILIILSGIVLL